MRACEFVAENFADKKVKGRSRPGRVRRAGASCKGSVTDLRARAKKYGGERGKMYHWCANMKSGRQRANEGIFMSKTVGPVKLDIDDHVVNRVIDRGANPDDVDRIIEHLPKITDQLSEIELGQRIWVWSPSLGLALALRRTSSQDLRFIMKTVWTAGRPSDYNVARIIEI